MKHKVDVTVVKLVLTFILFILGFFLSSFIWIGAYIVIAYDLFITIFKNFKKKKIFDENFLMIISSLGAIILGDFKEAIMIIWLYQLGEYIFDVTIDRSKASILSLFDLKSDKANLKKGNKIVTASSEKIKLEDIIVVKPGEKVPLDGMIVKGKSLLDLSSLTGESQPKSVMEKDRVLSGSINLNSPLEIKVTALYKDSTASKIVKAMEEASSRKAKSEKFITKFARFYTPIVIIGALLLFFIPVIFSKGNPSLWGYRSLVFLVSSCPCALIISIPLCYFCGIGVASKNNILFKGSSELEKLNKIDIVAFDKTGTITKGNFKITKVIPYYKKKEEFIKYLAYAEYYSNHPIASVIKSEYKRPINKEIISEYEELPGYGISVKINGEHVLVGNNTLFEQNNIEYPHISFLGTVVLVALNNEYIGTVVIADELKESSYNIVPSLKNVGIKKIVMVSGDSEKVTKKVSKLLQFDDYFYKLLPIDKIKKVKELKKEGTVLFVGDGLNDAPVMLEADLSMAMGNMGSDASIEASDIVIMNDRLDNLVKAKKIAKKTRNIVMFNILFSILTKMIIMGLGAFGIASIWSAVFADVGVTILVILNALRIFKQDYSL